MHMLYINSYSMYTLSIYTHCSQTCSMKSAPPVYRYHKECMKLNMPFKNDLSYHI